ncbi:hypothetical protein C3B59_05815 [Cryobacterium zongtaii]|uniref:Uncharacterized protein n=1 Tax=Cryobacterium zongtaii TaxID=1259217 RepID=A0A2S3ZLC2_9MICO|nr:hypothetical protein [Cryobacterium zongtaii]POH69154.1 hypothetical protein C3B59_05815 [Cryobacterium zongtaii]
MYLSYVVVTGPVRSSDDIAADRKAANAFFARYATPGWKSVRDLERLVEFYSYDWNLVCCVLDARVWTLDHGHDNAVARGHAKAARAALEAMDAIPARDDSKLRPYVHYTTTRRMPAPGLIASPIGECLTGRREATRFWALCQNPTPVFIDKVLHAGHPFTRWALLNPGYGPLHEAPDNYQGTSRTPKELRFRKGTIRPGGMSYDRALEIAVQAMPVK